LCISVLSLPDALPILPLGCSILLPVARKALFLPPVARSANAPTGTPARQTACLPLEAEGREVGTGSKKRHRKQRADQQTLPVITALGEGHDKGDDDGDGQHDADEIGRAHV